MINSLIAILNLRPSHIRLQIIKILFDLIIPLFLLLSLLQFGLSMKTLRLFAILRLSTTK